MQHKIDLRHIVIRSHSGRYILLEADRYQKFYLVINAPQRYENLIGKRIPKHMVQYKTKNYSRATGWIMEQHFREAELCTEKK